MSHIIFTLFDLDYDDLINNIVPTNTKHVRTKSDVIYIYRSKRFIIEMNNSYTSLIDIDNFDILDKLHKKDMKHEFIYTTFLTYILIITLKKDF